METNNWQQIETFFHSALSLSGEERTAYLSQACAEDNSLRCEVESLIAAFEENGEFLDEPAFDLGIKVIESDLETSLETSLAGQTIGSYNILSKLGIGGMGEVYLADDTRLNRKVALKFLSKALLGDKWAKRQLIKEAQAVAMLDHPNVCPVYGIEEIGEHNFIVMQYVEGETLADLVRQRRLTTEQVSSLARQIASAIEAAHAHGIIHRDIKTGNIMVTASGQAKVLDFGLAKIIEPLHKAENGGENISQFSQNGLIMGTVSYMSPEQLKAEKLDFRTDIFSFGTVLYELASGEHPFLRKSDAETITAILTDQPASARNFNNKSASSGIYPVVRKCLEKNKEQRFQSASELLLELQNLQDKKTPIIKRRLFFPLLSASLIILLLLSIGTLLYQRATAPRTLAVLPFINESGNSSADYISEGMAESLINKLSDSSDLHVKAFTLVSGYKGDIDSVKIGQFLDVEAVLTGKIHSQNGQLRLEAKLINTTDGTQHWGDDVPLNESDALSIQNNISEIVISKLQSPANNEKSKNRATNKQENPEAYNYYLQGRHYWKNRGKDEENILRAIEAFDKAIKIDPNYARAYAGLADAYTVRSLVTFKPMPAKEAATIAKFNAERAISIDGSLCESHVALGVVLHRYEWEWAAAEREYKRAIELNPDYAQAYYSYSNLLAVTGRHEEALAQSLKAKEVDPFSSQADVNIGRVLYYARRYDESYEQLTSALKEDPNNSGAEFIKGLIHLRKGKYEEALKRFEKLYASGKKDKLMTAAVLGFTYGKMGRKPEAQKVLKDLEELETNTYIPPQEKAIIYLGLNEMDKAIFWFEESFEKQSSGLVSINVEPLYDELRWNSRFQSIVSKMNLNPNWIVNSARAKF
ncbi:MAG TPA: protein kinase [Pyrinomonadaceae bacterium]|jgi:serine/threonine-protein kinase